MRLPWDSELKKKNQSKNFNIRDVPNIENLHSDSAAELSHPLTPSFFGKEWGGRDEERKLSPLKRLILFLIGQVCVGRWIRPGWSDPLSFYAFKCPVHGIVEDYPHGYVYRLDCPMCRLEGDFLKNLTFELSRTR